MISVKENITGSLNAKQKLTGKPNIAIKYVNPITQEKEVTPSKVVQIIKPDEEYTGLSKVTVDKYTPDVISKTITQNGTYKANDDGVDGYDEVNVVTSSVDINDYFNDTIPNQGAGVPAKAVQFLIKKVPAFNFSGNLFNGIFKNMEALEEIDLSKCDFSKVENISDCFYSCKSLKQIDLLAINNNLIDDIGNLIRECSNLEKFDLSNCSLEKVVDCVGAFIWCPKLTELKLKPNHNIGKGYKTTASENYSNYALQFYGTQSLTHESLMGIINGLYDIKTAGVKPQQLTLGTTNLAKLTSEEIAIATNKGWTVS